MNNFYRCVLGLVLVTALCACGKDADLTCDNVQTYQLAVAGKRVVVTDDLDALDPLKEVPLPEASPQPPRPPGSACIDRPPKVKLDS